MKNKSTITLFALSLLAASTSTANVNATDDLYLDFLESENAYSLVSSDSPGQQPMAHYMEVDAAGRYLFFSPDNLNTPIIVIDPNENSASITILGKKVLLENELDATMGNSNGNYLQSSSAPLLGTSGGMMLMAVSGANALANGNNSNALGDYASAYGADSMASGYASSAYGAKSEARGSGTSAFGWNSKATENNTSAFGDSAKATGLQSSTYGAWTLASGERSSAFGISAYATSYNSTALGSSAFAEKDNATATGVFAKAVGLNSSAYGSWAEAKETAASAFGNNSKAWGSHSSAYGNNAKAWGANSNAYGNNAKASGEYSNAYGYLSEASGIESSAFGKGTVAQGDYSTALGVGARGLSTATVALGSWSAALGYGGIAIGDCVQAGERQIALGVYNLLETDALFMLGNGNDVTRSNAMTISKKGKMTLKHKDYTASQNPVASPTKEALEVKGDATFRGRVVIEPQGDISMGGFTSTR